MLNKILALLLSVLVLLALGNQASLKNFRTQIETKILLPLRSKQTKKIENMQTLRVKALEEKIRKLESENVLLRQQLGTIPERKDLYPVDIIWYGEGNFEVNYPYKRDHKLVGLPVLWQETLVGYVKRAGEKVLYISEPTSSTFSSLALTDRKTKGTVRGNFNQQVYFETEQKEPLAKGDKVYVIDRTEGTHFFLGEVNNIENDKRLPVKRGYINYSFSPSKVSTVFIVQ